MHTTAWSHFTLLVTTDPATSQTTRLKPPSLNTSFFLWLLQPSWFRLLILLLLLLPHICDTFRYDILRISGTLFVWVIKKGKLVRHRFFLKTGEAYVNSKQTPFEVSCSFLYFDCNLHTHDDEPHPHLTHILK